MYNRYIPQPDGTYRKNRIPDPPRPEPAQKCPPQKSPSLPPKKEPCPPPPPPPCKEPAKETGKQKCSNKQPPCRQQESITGFFKNLLPKDMDTGDLLIILLLLLMAGDCEEDRNHALLTLALYFFM